MRLCTIHNAIKLILILTKSYQEKKDVLNVAMRHTLYKALKISVDIVSLKITSYKNLYTLIGLYQEAEEIVDITKPREFSIGAFGLVGHNEIISIYEKFTFTDKEELEKSLHYHFMIRKLILHVFPIEIPFMYPHYKCINSTTQPQSPIVSFPS